MAVLHVHQLHAAYGAQTVLHGITLDIQPGQLTIIVGPNGCGKSTLLRTIARLHRPAAGHVRIGDHDVWLHPARQAARLLALMPQSPIAPEQITVRALVEFGRHPHQSLFRQWSATDDAQVRQAITETGLDEVAEARVDQLSGGQRQRCWLAMALAQDTPVVLLDEPTSMLDIGHTAEVMRQAKRIAASGKTIIMVMHDLVAAARYADTLIAMKAGHVVAEGAPRTIIQPPLIRELYGIDAGILYAPDDGSPIVVPHI